MCSMTCRQGEGKAQAMCMYMNKKDLRVPLQPTHSGALWPRKSGRYRRFF